MAQREISNLDLKIKLLKEYLENGGIQKLNSPRLLKDLMDVRGDIHGKVDPDTVSSLVNAMMITILADHMSPPVFYPEYISEYQSTLQKSNSFDQENIDTEEQFDKVYDEYKEKDNTLFRGQREAKWRLYSKLQRQWILEKLFQTEENYQKLIERLVDTGKTDCRTQIKELLNVQHIDTENAISVLSYLQHHDCPTPLLDWTYKFQNAVYFAIDSLAPKSRRVEIEDYCSVYYIDEKHFEGVNIRTIMSENLDANEEPMLQTLIAQIANGDKEKRKAMEKYFAGRKVIDRTKIAGSGLISKMTTIEYLMIFPLAYFNDKDTDTGINFYLNNSKNILNQEGVFTWNSDSSKPFEMVGDEQYREGNPEEEGENYRFCSCFNIHKKLESHIRKRLEADGITKDYIYPTPEISTWEIFEKSKMKNYPVVTSSPQHNNPSSSDSQIC